MGPRSDGGTRGVTPSLDSERLALLVHEVRSPVAALSAIAETLGEGRSRQSRRADRLIRLVTLACRGIERIVADAAVASIRLESIDPVGLVGDVVAAAKLRGGAVELTAKPGSPTRRRRSSATPAGARQPHRQRPAPWGRAAGVGRRPRRHDAADRDLRYAARGFRPTSWNGSSSLVFGSTLRRPRARASGLRSLARSPRATAAR